MAYNLDDALTNKEHWAKYVMSVRLPPVFSDKAVDAFKDITGRTLSKQYVLDVRSGRCYNRLLHHILNKIGKEHEQSGTPSAPLGKESRQAGLTHGR